MRPLSGAATFFAISVSVNILFDDPCAGHRIVFGFSVEFGMMPQGNI
jgi:hypothetical protein